MAKVRKAVIPAAGFGTRFLPATKAMPKEMLPVVDKPVIQYVVEEAVASGIEDIIIVTGWHKRSIEDHFDYPFELEKRLEAAEKQSQIEEVRRIAEMANFVYIRQKGPYGNGTPVLNARHVIGDEPFAVLWGDQFTWAETPRLKQCLETFQEFGEPVLSGVKLAREEDASRYGIFDITPTRTPHTSILNRLVEKPLPNEAPSDLLADGCYVLTPDIFTELEHTRPGHGNEIFLANAIDALSKKRKAYVREIAGGRYYDTGNKLEYLKTVVEFALKREDLKAEFREFLIKVLRA
ncbi:UTP--glucose-1-phosphate uridylyltransferase [Candidatus Berkelbacteria bacterium]|nr:UTP--glucose-1-phosphate uridylyltransferase [Candidatus Berkelbacteria bacterium]